MAEHKRVTRTRKDHKCRTCHETIPKGTLMSEIGVEECWGSGSTSDITPIFTGHYRYRTYSCKTCVLLKSLGIHRRDPFRADFRAYRSVVSMTYYIGGVEEITVPLTPGDPYKRGNWNKAVERSDRIYELLRVNRWLMHPELTVNASQYPLDENNLEEPRQ